MKKVLTLRLIEDIRSPQVGDLVLAYNKALYINGNSLLPPNDYKVVKPYGISNDEIKVGDTYIRKNKLYTADGTEVSIINGFPKASRKRVELLPEQFNYEDIVRLGLRDGSEFEVEYWTKNDAIRDRNPDFIPDVLNPDRVTYIPKLVDGKAIISEHLTTIDKPTPPDSILVKEGKEPVSIPSILRIHTKLEEPKREVLYTESEVKRLFTKLIQDYPIHSARMRDLIPEWFEMNRKH